MKKIIFLISILVSVVMSASQKPEYSKAGFWELSNCGREVYNFNVGWRFFKGEIEGAQAIKFDDSEWAKVNCPHGLEYNTSEASGGVNYQGPAWYRKYFKIDDKLSKKQLKIHFESIMGKCKVWLNGVQVGEHYGGYLPFTVSLNKHLRQGENVLAVWADNSDDPTFAPGQPQNRLDFAYFGGIYRDVWMIATNDVYVSNPTEENKVAGGGIFTHVQSVSDSKAILSASVDINNDGLRSQKVEAHLSLLSPKGKEVESHVQSVEVRAGRSAQIKQVFSIPSPALWTPWTPSLYKLQVVLKDAQHTAIDGVAIKTGLRVIEFKGKEGFYLNNKPYPEKLMGVNRHQDYAYVGNALPNNGQWRDAQIIKSSGNDIVRAAHYPADPAFMDACDALGLFYINATPGWHFWNKENDIFEKRVYEDIRDMVRRDRNYACNLMWEPILNETSYPSHFAKNSHDIVHEEYPFNGAFTVSDNRADGQEYFDVLYANDYNADYINEDRCYFQREWGDNVDDFNAQNSTSRVARGWGERPQLIQALRYAEGDYEKFSSFESIYKTPKQFIGGSLWAGFDHQRGYAVDPFYGGLTDVFRQPKYSYHLFASQRNVSKNYEPMVYIAHEMTPFSEPDVTVFTNCEQVRLTVYEGEKVVQKKANPSKYLRVLTPHGQPNYSVERGTKSYPHPYVTFENIYEFMDLKSLHRGKRKYKATLVAEGVIDGKVVCSYTKTSGKKPTALKLTLENRNIPWVANGSDFVLVVASIVDEKGNIKRLNENLVKFEVVGEGAIIGNEAIDANPKRISWGTAPVLVRSTTKAGKVIVKASLLYEGINSPLSAELEIESMPTEDKMLYSEVGKESGETVFVDVEETSEEQLKEENERLKKQIMNYKLKEEERSQLEQDEHR